MINRNSSVFPVILVFFALSACTPDYYPKPKGYNRLELPVPSFVNLPDTFPYSFQYSAHAQLLRDSSWISEKYWIDLFYPDLGANVQVTYKPIRGLDQLLQEYQDDSYKLTSKHQVKAYSIEDTKVLLPNGDVAMVTELEGEVPSQFQFYVTDSVQHFLRGALYFKTATRNDSLAPAIEYMKQDIMHMLNTLRWTN